MTNDRTTHFDLLSQVTDSEEEERDARRILSAQVTEAEITRINAERLDGVESAVRAWHRAPHPIAPANHAHRYSVCSGPCKGGTKTCATPDACERADEPRPEPRAGDMVRVGVIFLAAWAAIVFALVATGVSL